MGDSMSIKAPNHQEINTETGEIQTHTENTALWVINHHSSYDCNSEENGETSASDKSSTFRDSTSELASVSTSQLGIWSPLHTVKPLSLTKFQLKPSMTGGNEGRSSDEEIDHRTSLRSIPRPSFPSDLISPDSSFVSNEGSAKSTLHVFTPHPGFDVLADELAELHCSLDSPTRPSDKVVKSASDSTLLNGLSEGSLDSCSSEDSDNLGSSTMSRDNASPTAQKCPELVNGSGEVIGGRAARRRIPRTMTHPLCPSKGDVKETKEHRRLVKTSNVQEGGKSEGAELGGCSPELAAFMSQTSAPAASSSKSSERNRSEPFPEGHNKPASHPGLSASISAPVINSSHSCLQSVAEGREASLTTNVLKVEDRKEIVKEMIDSERRYVTILEQMSQAVQKLREGDILDDELLNTMFYNLRLGELAVHHKILLESLLKQVANDRNDQKKKEKVPSKWDVSTSSIGAVMCSTFQSSTLNDNYMAYVKHNESAKELIKQQIAKNAAFMKFNARFELENRHDLNNAVTLPANRLLSYKMLLERYHKCTPAHDPDYDQVPKAIQIVNNLLDNVGKVDPAVKWATLKAIEGILEVAELAVADREFLRVDTVRLQGQSGEFRLWLFNDLVLISLNKMHRKADSESLVLHGKHGQDILPRNKKSYKMYRRIGLDDLEVISSPELEVKKYREDIKVIESDLVVLKEIQSKAEDLSHAHRPLITQVSNVIRRCEHNLHSLRQRTQDTNLSSLRLLIQSSDKSLECQVMFASPRTRSAWEADLVSAKRNLEVDNVDKRPPEFVCRIPVKTRAGMQFTCAASLTSHAGEREVWFCNSDNSTGHLCRMSVSASPSLLDSVPVPNCNSRVSCICTTPPHCDTVLDGYGAQATALDLRQSLTWLGCDDGTLYILASSRRRQPFADHYLSINCEHPILGIVHQDGRVFVALNKRKLKVFHRNQDGLWSVDTPHPITLNTQGTICQLLPVACKLWCASGREITVLDGVQPERTFEVSAEKNVSIQAMAYSRQGIVAVALKSSCELRLFHHSTFKHLADINVFSSVAQKLSKCDEIITQHKLACLKVTSLVCCKHVLWVGTTAGVLLTLRFPKMHLTSPDRQHLDTSSIPINALDIGHTGNVRFLTFADLHHEKTSEERRHSVARYSLVSKMLVISGGDGFEVIDPGKQPKDAIGFNDSINHLLVWKV